MSSEAIIPIALAVLMVVLTAVYVWLTHKILQKQSRKEELKEYDLYLLCIKKAIYKLQDLNAQLQEVPTSAIDGDFTEWSANKLKNIIGELTGHIDSHIRFFSTQLSEILNIVEPIRTAPELIEHYLPDVVKRAQIEKIQIMVTKLNEIHDTTVKKAKKLSYIK